MTVSVCATCHHHENGVEVLVEDGLLLVNNLELLLELVCSAGKNGVRKMQSVSHRKVRFALAVSAHDKSLARAHTYTRAHRYTPTSTPTPTPTPTHSHSHTHRARA